MKNKRSELFEWLIVISTTLLIMIFIRSFLFVGYSVSGDSMKPEFHDKDRLIVSKISKTFHSIERQDVIVLHYDDRTDYIKRIIGMPGDKIEYRDDTLYVNDKKIDEPYLSFNKEHSDDSVLMYDFTLKTLPVTHTENVPNGKYFVLGDNREISYDGDDFGYIDEDQIVGKVVLRYYPFNHFSNDFNDGD